MTKLQIWWHSKNREKKQNWMSLALACCIIASGFVEAGIWWPVLVGIVPGIGVIWLECKA